MEKLMTAAWLCCCLSITAGEDSQDAGNVEIENCNEGFIDIRENANNTIKCKGFNGSETIAWAFKRDDENMPNGVATCYASSYCTFNRSDHFAVERSESESTLFYQQYDREADKGANVTCASLCMPSKRTKTCSLNVINHATLSSCTVNEDRVNMTVTGRCRYEHAYSFRRGFQCTWYQETDGMCLSVRQSRSFSGNIMYESGSHNATGWCTFNTTLEPGNHTYSINFYPGPGNITVNAGNIESSLETQDEIDLPIAAIVGGIVASVAVIIISVVVVVVFIGRKRRQKAASTKENSDSEEHINPMYVTSDDLDDTHTTDHKLSAIALRISPNSHNGHPAAPHSLEADMYSTVDSEASHAPRSAACRSGGYEDIDFDSNGSKRVPQKDEYAVVDKSRAQKGPASSANTSASSISSPAHATKGSDEYAVVDKSSSRNKAAKSVASDLPDVTANNAGADVYAQVIKPAKKVKVAEPKTEGDAYALVQKPKPATKPNTSGNPLSDKDETQRSAADDDEYHTLSHTRGSPHTQDQADLESQYSHIGHD